MDLAETFAAMPGATPIEGLPDAWVWTLGQTYGNAAALTKDGKHAFHCYAHDSWDEGLARAIVTFAREHAAELIAPDRPLVVVEGFKPPGYAFDTVVGLSPTVHKFNANQPDIHRATCEVIPAYRCEFAGDETEVEAATRCFRAAGAQPTRWNREPNPYLQMRMRAANGQEIPKRGFANPPKLLHELRQLPDRENGFVELENYQRRVWTVTWQDTYLLAGPDADQRSLDFDALVEFAKEVLYGPNRSAGEHAFNKPR
ncbi:hypothetical protein [Actinophytocola sp.]|uniref:hypothetical protein n=1 Tax=Actinophytocola sp. TaxID=1872138 RepID=UPI002D7EA53F|nr:hypothetical protein [Actinophytocola sp.]HET9140171.1 hypothetical protein [Actinophytocola sp.]